MAMIRNGPCVHMLKDVNDIGESMMPALQRTASLMNAPYFARVIFDWWNNATGKARFAEFMDGGRPLDYYPMEDVLRLRQQLNDEVAVWW